MEDSKKDFKKARSIFDKLKTDPLSVAFAGEILDKKLLLKLKKSKYVDNKIFFKLVNLLENSVIFESESVKRTDYVEKREIDHSTLYSFDAPFQLFRADVGNLEFLDRNATFPQYVLVLVDLFSSKVYTYAMKSIKQIIQKLEQFYRDVRSKKKGKKMKLQIDQEFQQVRIKDLHDLNNVHMFSTSLSFAAEQKIRELKTRISKLASQKLKISLNKIIEISTSNMNIQPSKKYDFSPEEVEKRELQSERFRTVYNMHRLEKTDKLNQRQVRYDKEKYDRKQKRLRENLNIIEKAYVLVERIKTMSTLRKFYKQLVQNMSYFNKDTVLTIRKLTFPRELKKRFQRSELFPLNSNFL